jgi:adenylate cyclase
MTERDEEAIDPPHLAVLYADIVGSTAMYEEHGDAKARDTTSLCVTLMTQVIEKFNGRVAKTIGDEVMAVFHDPASCMMASTDLQGAIRRASEAGRFVTGPLRIKVGVHFGPGQEEETDVHGEASIVAQQVINLAKADQTLVSDSVLENVPDMLRMGSRFFEGIVAERTARPIDVHELIWEVSDLTQAANINLAPAKLEDVTLELNYMGEIFRINADRLSLVLGRVEGNDVVVPSDLTSRQHADIEYKRGRFQLTDNSANGTVVVTDDGTVISLRRESTILRRSGSICLGGTPESNPRGIITFRCE